MKSQQPQLTLEEIAEWRREKRLRKLWPLYFMLNSTLALLIGAIFTAIAIHNYPQLLGIFVFANDKNHPQGETWMVIDAACKAENCKDPRLIYAIWETETHISDCSSWRDKPGPNPCVSTAKAKGPFQFMDGTWPTYSEASWDRWDLYDSARATARMTTKLGLFDQVNRDAFAEKFSGNPCWNCGVEGYAQGLKIWDLWHNYQQKLQLVMPAQDLTISQGFNQPYPDTPELRALGLAGVPHKYGTDLVKVEQGHGVAFDILAVADGKILEAVQTPDVGFVIKLIPNSAPNVEVQYWHLGVTYVNSNDNVRIGDKIGIANGSGSSSTGPHLHLRLTIDGADVDPMSYMMNP